MSKLAYIALVRTTKSESGIIQSDELSTEWIGRSYWPVKVTADPSGELIDQLARLPYPLRRIPGTRSVFTELWCRVDGLNRLAYWWNCAVFGSTRVGHAAKGKFVLAMYERGFLFKQDTLIDPSWILLLSPFNWRRQDNNAGAPSA